MKGKRLTYRPANWDHKPKAIQEALRGLEETAGPLVFRFFFFYSCQPSFHRAASGAWPTFFSTLELSLKPRTGQLSALAPQFRFMPVGIIRQPGSQRLQKPGRGKNGLHHSRRFRI
jgi:hypothetical protein